MSQQCQVVSTLRNVNQITAYETNGVSFLLGKCEPPAGLLCSAEGTELPAGYGPVGQSPTESNKNGEESGKPDLCIMSKRAGIV